MHTDMKPEHQRIFDSAPAPAHRSKLDAYAELLLRWKRQGRTYRNIRELAQSECNLKMSIATLHGFIKRRSKTRKPKPDADLEMEQPASAQTIPISTSLPGKLTPEERERQRAILKALREKSVVAPKEDDDFPLWDPDKPLTNKPTSEEK